MYNNNTLRMLEHFQEEWLRNDVFVVLPTGTAYSAEWSEISKKDIKITYFKEHELSTEWTIIVHDTFKFGVVENKHGFHIQQLTYQP